jgi:D-alanine-D-alanine ligase
LAVRLLEVKPDVIFNALHGTYGEDGCVQGLLEVTGIPYTHSGVMASAIAMNKQMTKMILEHHGILFPAGRVAKKNEILAGDLLPRPFVVKPVADGSSVGVVIVTEDSPAHISAEQLPAACDKFLVEQYIPGRELSVAVLEGEALGVVELRPKDGFYNYENKYKDGKTEHLLPAPVPEGVYQGVMKIAALAHRILECRGITRSDFRYNEKGNGRLYMLEINTQPGFTPLSLAPEMAKHAGISFDMLVKRLVESAQCDHS